MVDYIALLALAAAHPELPRMWGKDGINPDSEIDLGEGWKFKYFHHWPVPHWICLRDPDGREFEFYLSDPMENWFPGWIATIGGQTWDINTQDMTHCRVKVSISVQEIEQAEAALVRFLKMFS